MKCVRALAPLLSLVLGSPALAQLSAADIAALQAQGKKEGWTFVVRESDATKYPLEVLCGTKVPDGWVVKTIEEESPNAPLADLPAAFDWRTNGGVTSVKNQGGCGSCWAFAAVGAVESAIRINLGIEVNLSEQWLVSCTSAGDCSGGWHDSALCVMTASSSCHDSCGDSGAVLESAFPYVAWNAPCGCPYAHPYALRSYSYVTSTATSIKQAIYNHGPVSTTVYVNSAFHAYGGGVFNGCEDKTLNHAVLLVGWNDNDSGGIWIMKNSWGTGWGENGYMRIPYGCSRIGQYTYSVGFDLPAPTGLTASDDAFTDRIRVTWTGNAGAKGYEVWRGLTDNSSSATMIGETTTTTYDDMTPAPDTIYFYWAKARNQIETSVFSNSDSGSFLPDCNDNGVWDTEDIANHTSLDCNANGVPDECDPDEDGDGLTDDCDLCTDTDGDGPGDPGFPANTCPQDNCPYAFNPDQVDTDGDGFGNACDACPGFDDLQDADGDGTADGCDVCPETPAGTPASRYGCPFCAADFDHDGDVDQADFGHMQVCMSGSTLPQDDPDCWDARLDADTDVDDQDFQKLRPCMDGADVPADPDCAD